MFITYIFIAITALISISAFSNADIINKLIFYPAIMKRPVEWYRLLTAGFIHADWNHLIINMLSLYFFGRSAEYFLAYNGHFGVGWVCLLYLAGIVMASVPSFINKRNDRYYSALGASGGVAAVVFYVIYYAPWAGIGIMFIPIRIPAIIYGVLYTLYSSYMSKKGMDNIGHDAHLSGSLYGFAFAYLTDPTHGLSLINQLMHPQFDQL